MYLVTNGSRPVDALVNPIIPPTNAQDVISSNTGSQYQVYSTSGTKGYKKYSDMFTYTLEGQTPTSITDQAGGVLIQSWKKKLQSKLMIYLNSSGIDGIVGMSFCSMYLLILPWTSICPSVSLSGTRPCPPCNLKTI